MSIHSRLISIGVAGALCCAAASSQTTVRLSIDANGVQANALSSNPVLSTDGRFIAFVSDATNLVVGDANGRPDLFVFDRSTGFSELASVSSAGVQGNQDYGIDGHAISADGRFVAFSTNASNLAPSDTNGVDDVFVHDRQTGATERVSVGPLGVQGNSWSSRPSLSADGRYVGFTSVASNLVPGDTEGQADVFVFDRLTHVCERVSVDSAGHAGTGWSDSGAISADGRFVAFRSGSALALPNTQGYDIFVHDRATGTTERASISPSGAPFPSDSSDPSISADGGTVGFLYLGNVYVHVRATGVTELVSQSPGGVPGNAVSGPSSLSADGRYVAFWSSASNLVAGDVNNVPDAFVRDRQLSRTTIASLDSYGAQGDYYTLWPSISGDGRFVAFGSEAANFVPGDTNSVEDVFLRDRDVCATGVASYCTAKVNSAGCTPRIVSTGNPSASAGSGFVIGAEQVLDHRNGVLFYGVHGANGTSFQGGFLCVAGPVRRTSVQVSSSSGAPPCTGVYAYDFNARIASLVDSALVPGQQVWTQYWSRDTASPSGTGLTDALTFVVCQ